MKAILSDIHGNLEALQAVLADIERHDAKDIYCLGDVIGYGPDPRACLDLVMQRCKVMVLGNHEAALFTRPRWFTPVAEQAIQWTRAQLEAPVPTQAAVKLRWEFLQERPVQHQEGELLFVHGSPCEPLSEYVLPRDIGDDDKMGRLFAEVGHFCFQGHTHVPGVFTERCADGQHRLHHFSTPDESGCLHRFDEAKALVNVGSVGQPRDGDRRACYVLLDGDVVRWRRIEYDVAATVKKIHAATGLDNSLGARLRQGR